MTFQTMGDRDELDAALYHLDPSCGREEWFKALAAYKAGGGSQEVAEDWSAGGDSFNQRDFRATWRSIRIGRGYSEKTLFWLARSAGWMPGHQATNPSDLHLVERPKPKAKPPVMDGSTWKIARDICDNAQPLDEEEARYTATAERAQKAWDLATPAPDNHPYLIRKAVQPYGVGVLGCQYPDAPACVRDRGNLLVIPVMTDHVHSVQFIAEDGTKAFIHGSQRPGGYYQIGKQTERTWLCEGFATGASIHEASGERVIVCFNTNGLKRVAASISNPKLNLVVMADDDWQTKGNPGLTAAKWIQEHHSIDYVSPEWGDLPRQPKDSDYNDLLRLRGQHG